MMGPFGFILALGFFVLVIGGAFELLIRIID